MTEPSKRATPPYTSANDTKTVFERIKQLGKPNAIDSKWVTNYQLAKSQPAAVVALLKWLRVIDDQGRVDDVWNELRTNQPATLSRLVRESYADVFSAVEVATADRQAIDGAFITAYQTGDTGRPVVAFLTLCDLAGIPTAAGSRPASGAPHTPRANKRAPSPSGGSRQRQSSANTGHKDWPRDHVRGVSTVITLNVEIPATWTENEVTARIAAVMSAVTTGTTGGTPAGA